MATATKETTKEHTPPVDEQLRKSDQQARAEAFKIIREVAERDLSDRAKRDDGERLRQALVDLREDRDFYRRCREAVRRHREVRAKAAGVDKAGRQLSQARKKHREYQAETEKIIAERREKEAELDRKTGEAAREMKQAQDAAQEQFRIEREYPYLLGAESVDFDRYTLMNNGNKIRWHDPNAKVMRVDRETFQRESDRRSRIMQTAWERKREEFDQAKAKFEASKRRESVGHNQWRWITDQDPPQFERPTWAEVVERGWNVEGDE